MMILHIINRMYYILVIILVINDYLTNSFFDTNN